MSNSSTNWIEPMLAEWGRYLADPAIQSACPWPSASVEARVMAGGLQYRRAEMRLPLRFRVAVLLWREAPQQNPYPAPARWLVVLAGVSGFVRRQIASVRLFFQSLGGS